MGDSIPRSRPSSICTDLKNHEQTTDSFTATSSAISINSRILIVDDEPDVATLYKLSLEYNGFAVDAFNDPLVAFSKYKPDVYDLLLLDIRMPGMKGFELYKNIKNIDHKAKVCFITAFEEYEHDFKDLYPKLDIDCFIGKPIECII
jgi:DNA-binding response OmpR family regulator